MRNKLLFSVLALVVATQAWAFSSKREPKGASGPAPDQLSNETVWVSRPDGSKQCEADAEKALQVAAEELQKAGVPVLEKRKGSDGKIRAQVCGAPTGGTNSFRIPKGTLSRALELGFKETR